MRRSTRTVFLSLSLAASPVLALAAQIPFGPQEIVSTSNGIGLDVIAGDLDGDGDLDLVGSGGSNAGSGVYWYENLDGTGKFSTSRAIGAGQLENRGSIELVDMDQDGDLDLLSGWFYLAAWYPNDGHGNFGARTVIRDETFNGAGYDEFAAADLDGDGDPDVIGLSGSVFGPTDKLVWFRNNGGGTFNPATENFIDALANENGVGHVAPADLDGDGDIDLVATQTAPFGGDNRVVWYKNIDGAGSFSGKLTISTATQQLSDVAVTDVDGDGDLDVVSADYGFNAVRWHENTAGNGSAWTDHLIDATASVSYFVNVADMDLDGDPDVLVATRVTNEARWIENTAGNGSAWTNRLITGGVANPAATIAADLDGDGDLDVATASVNDNKIAWNENRTIHRNAVFGASVNMDGTVGQMTPPRVADLDRDGDPDVVVTMRTDGRLVWLDNNGTSPDLWPLRNVATGIPSFTESSTVADLDGDGDLDVAISPGGGFLHWYQSNGAPLPAFTDRSIPSSLTPGLRVASGDIDGDGDVDLLALSYSALAWYDNDGAALPGWTERSITGSFTNPRALLLADLDRDGDLDVVTSNADAPRLVWYENNGATPPLWTARTILTPPEAITVEAADVDGDGDLDLVAASATGSTVLWFQNGGGSPIAWTQRTVASGFVALNAVPVDLDRDGDIDIMTSNSGVNQIWYESNGGSPPLWTPRSFAAFNQRYWAPIDLNGDGDVDLIQGSYPTPVLSAFENLGGQYGFTGADVSTGAAYDGEVVPVLAVSVQVNGRPGDSVGRVATLDIKLESGSHVALSSAQANALFDELRVYRDDGDGTFKESQDILVATVGTLSLTGGVQTVTLPANDPNVRVAAPATFFVAPLMAPNASVQAVSSFFAIHRAAAGSIVVDANAGLTLVGAATTDVTTASAVQARPRFVVNATSDAVDASPGDGVCATAGSVCTLRAAIQEANAHAGVDRIVLPVGTFTITVPGTNEDAAATGDLDITDASGRLTLVGQGADKTVIVGDGIDRVLHLPGSAALTLEDVTITGGHGNVPVPMGGGLLLTGTSSATIRRCSFRGNDATARGGALAINGGSVLTVEDSVFHGNTGFEVSTIQANSSGSTSLSNCTISGNTAASATGVAVEGASPMTLSGCTVSGNTGGLRSTGVSITLANSIVAGNPSAGLTGDDINTGSFVSSGYNLIGESASGAFVNGVNGDKVGSIGAPLDPKLKPLGEYGGPTLTQPPFTASPAVDAGRCGTLVKDQRGVKRPIDLTGVANANDGCDMGAYEVENGTALSRLEVPIRWCGLHGSPSIENPSLMGAGNVNDLLRLRHEVASDNIYAPQTGIAFRSAANFSIANYPVLEDPDCVQVTPGNYSCTKGVRGDVYIDPNAAIFDEYEELIAACRAAWQAMDPKIEGITAVQINHFVDKNGTPLSILGIGGRAKEGDVREQADAGRVAVVDHFYRQSANPSDTIDRLLGHELGHALSLRHGDGLDNDVNGVIDDNDEAVVGLPRFDGNNVMQYRSGTTLTTGQATQARSHLLATVPDVAVQPFSDAVPNAVPTDPANARVLEFGFGGVLNLANARVLEFKNANVLEFENDKILDLANARVLEFKNANVLEFENARVLEFGMSYDGEAGTASTRLHATTGAIPWPPSLRPATRYFFYLDVDRDDGTGAYPADKVNPSDAPNHFPGSNNFLRSPNVAVEAGVDLIAQVEVQSSCAGTQCSTTSLVRIFDYNDATGLYTQVSSSPSPTITAVDAALYIDNGGAPVDLDTASSGITVQPAIPNSLLFAAGWGFTTPPGGGAPVPNPVRMEVLTTIGCVGNVLNDGSAASSRNCQCVSCASCPNYPGCVGSVGVPQTLTGTTILADHRAAELTFQPPVLPACNVIPVQASQGQAVAVYVTNLPTNLAGTVEVTRNGSVIGTAPVASISPAGFVSVAATLPPTALGQVTLSTGITGYAPRAQCVVTVSSSLACPDADGDGTCDNVDSDDDNDGVTDAGDASPLNPRVCRDVDLDQCDDCASGVSAPLLDGPDYDHDGLCDFGDPDDDNDGVLDAADGQPKNSNACGDTDGDQCDDCVIAASPSPGNDGPDVDADGLCDFGDPDDDNDGASDWADCAPLNGTLKASPVEVAGVGLGSGGNKNRLSWTAPQAQGGSATFSDVVRGTGSGLPVGSGPESCVAIQTSAAQVDDATSPTPGQLLWYLVRARNACGLGGYGTRTGGVERTTSACP